ncbi:hypothetical protein LCGC14_1672820 [marine sediment metagenome]|uniref:Novel STAND NTPase 3 domain-containing protein n=1 Tax=marine sediment metagenome TaxID=412755 RepID=A0A0F9K6L5_9ZZZZ
MLSQNKVLEGLQKILDKITVVNLSGESGTGKTSLALYLASYLLKDDHYCIWVQASELFPKKRLETMYGNNQKRLNILKNQILVAPDKCFATFDTQSEFMIKITHENYLFPPDLQFFVIDNISHHLRFRFSKVKEISEKILLLDRFYSSELLPLILRCSRENIILILIHEVSFNINLQRNQPFFNRLYERIKGLSIVLKQSSHSKKQVMDISAENKKFSLGFKIEDNGFNFSQLFL